MDKKKYLVEVSREMHEKITEIKRKTGKTNRFLINELLEYAIKCNYFSGNDNNNNHCDKCNAQLKQK